MDKLKKNGFLIGTGVLGFGALILLYVLLIRNIFGDLQEAQGSMGAVSKKYKTLADPKKTPFVPSQQSKQLQEDAAKRWNETLKEGNDFYDAKKDKFAARFDTDNSGDDAAGFRSFYETKMKELRADYLKMAAASKGGAPAPAAAGSAAPDAAAPEGAAPGEAPPTPPAEGAEGEPAATPPEPAAPPAAPAGVPPATPAGTVTATPAGPTPPVISHYPKFQNVDDINRANKELRIADELFSALTVLKLGGLLELSFPERNLAEPSAAPSSKEKEAAKEAPRTHRWVRCRASIELPLLQLEPLLSKLLQSDQVPFRLDSLTMVRRHDTMQTKMVETVSFKNEAEADQKSGAALKPEPPVGVLIELSALDWLGPKPPEPAK
jgi:hypothetical protein